jgi:hypothetical protein
MRENSKCLKGGVYFNGGISNFGVEIMDLFPVNEKISEAVGSASDGESEKVGGRDCQLRTRLNSGGSTANLQIWDG